MKRVLKTFLTFLISLTMVLATAVAYNAVEHDHGLELVSHVSAKAKKKTKKKTSKKTKKKTSKKAKKKTSKKTTKKKTTKKKTTKKKTTKKTTSKKTTKKAVKKVTYKTVKVKQKVKVRYKSKGKWKTKYVWKTVTKKVAVNQHVHSYVTVAGRAATCTSNGLTNGVKCSTCGAWQTAQKTIPALGHNNVWVRISNPTCTSEGQDALRCTRCGAISAYRSNGPATGHTVNDWSVVREATCTTSGLQQRKCTSCDAVIESKTIKAKGHNYKITHTANGKTNGRRCTRCGYGVDPLLIPYSQINSRVSATVGTTKKINVASGFAYTTENEGICQVTADTGLLMPISAGTTYIDVSRTDGTVYRVQVNVRGNANVVAGADISYYQYDINLNTLKSQNINFVMIRAGHGLDRDSNFATNVAKAKAAGLQYGTYWYLTTDDITTQANAYVEMLRNNGTGDYPAFIDIEADILNVSDLGARVSTFVSILNNNGITNIGYYGSISKFKAQIANYKGANNWVAYYNNESNGALNYKGFKMTPKYWQTGSTYVTSACPGNTIDLDYMYVNVA